MRIEIPKPQPRKDGEFTFYVTEGYGEPHGTIWLDEAQALRLDYVTAEDCDRLIRAAAEVKQQVLSYAAKAAVPHGKRSVYQGTCQLCGKPEDDELHAEPAPVVRVIDVRAPAPEGNWCPAITVLDDDVTRLYCDRENGHPGSHHAPGPDEGSEVAWGDAVAAVAR
jgi:hypothetical protein